MEKLRPRRIIANKIASGNHHSMVWFFWSFFLVITFALTWFFFVIHQHTMLILREKKHTNKTMWCMWFRWSVDFLFLGDAKVCGPQKFWEVLVSLVRKLQQILQKNVTYSTSFWRHFVAWNSIKIHVGPNFDGTKGCPKGGIRVSPIFTVVSCGFLWFP